MSQQVFEPNRGLIINVDNPLTIWSSIIFAVLGGSLLFKFSQNEPSKEQSQEQQKKSKASGYKRDIIVYSIVLTAAVILAIFFVRSRDTVRELEKDPYYPQRADLPIAFFSFAFLAVSRVVLIPFFEQIGRKIIPTGKWKPEEYETRVQRFGGQFWKVIYHSFVTVMPLIFLRNEVTWWPPGANRFSGLWTNFPHIPNVPWLREFNLFQIGYYLLAMLVTLIQRSRPNYVEMTIHHTATLILTICSYFIQNNIRHGTVTLFVHDVCDIPVCLTRLVVDLPYALPTAIFYIWLMTFWAWFRLWVYPSNVVYVVAYKSLKEKWVKWEYLHSWSLTTPMLVILILMHWKWFFELLGMAKVYFKTGKRCDSTDAHKAKTTAASNPSKQE